MKNVLTIIAFALMAVLYCFANDTLSFYAIDSTDNSSKKENRQREDAEKSAFFSLTSVSLNARPPLTQSLAQTASQVVSFIFNSFPKLEYAAHGNEALFASLFAQYSIFSISLLIEQKKSELLFPAHYFW